MNALDVLNEYKAYLKILLDKLNVCGDGGFKCGVPLSRLKEAEKIIDEVMANG